MSVENDTPFVRITNREIYDGLVDVRNQVRSMESRLDSVLKENVDIKKEYGARLRSLELKVYTLLSGVVAAGAMLLKVGYL